MINLLVGKVFLQFDPDPAGFVSLLNLLIYNIAIYMYIYI